MTDVLLATCSSLPDGEDGGHRLVEEFKSRDLEAAFVAWDDPKVDWAAARLVTVRSTWTTSTGVGSSSTGPARSSL